jgi:pimeloyl-ACP methyl ester carboxylesterase
VLHGFPSSSYDFAAVLDDLRRTRRVLLLDLLGYGLSAKPDQAYTLAEQADIVMAFAGALGIDRLALLSHDLGDTVGGELLARQLDGTWPVEITRRVLTNGSIYIGMAQLSPGQQLLLALPDEMMSAQSALDAASVQGGLAATFSPASSVSDDELAAQWELIARDDGHRLLPRLIRYIEERRRDESRYTGAIESHPSPLHVVWGVDDPIAVVAMTDRLRAARPDAVVLLLDGVGHYPMIEAPTRFAAAVRRGLQPSA